MLPRLEATGPRNARFCWRRCLGGLGDVDDKMRVMKSCDKHANTISRPLPTAFIMLPRRRLVQTSAFRAPGPRS